MNIKDKIKTKTPCFYASLEKTNPQKILDTSIKVSFYQTNRYFCKKFYKMISYLSI